MGLLLLILLVLVVIGKCSAPGEEKQPQENSLAVQPGVYADGIVTQEQAQQLTQEAEEKKAAHVVTFFERAGRFVESPSMKTVPDPIAPGEEDPNADVFDNSVFVGNSCLEGLRNSGAIPNAVFLTKVGLNVNTVYEKAALGSSVPIMEELWSAQYKKVFLMFGENELGWRSTDIFIQSYGKIIDDIRERQPGAKIYVQSILPVSAEASARNQYNANNNRINEFNGLIEAMCKEKGVTYLNVAAALKDANGCLPSDASFDGIHPNAQYCQIWADYMRTLL